MSFAAWVGVGPDAARAAPADGSASVPVGVIVRSPADPPVPTDRVMDAVARAVRGGAAAPERDPFGAARGNLARGAVPVEQLAGFTRALHLAREGWQAYAAVDSHTARTRLAEAREVAEGVLHLDGGPALYADIALRHGAVLLQQGSHAQAAELFRLAQRLDADREVSEVSFAPDVVKAFRTAVTAAVAERVVRVTARPIAARIEIDGRDLGPAPVEARLPVGVHIAVIRSPGHRTRVAGFQVAAAAEPAEVAWQLDADPETEALARGPAALAAGTGADAVAVTLEAVIRYGELDSVAVVASVWQRGEPALLGQRCVGLPLECTRVVEIRHARPDGVAVAAVELWATLSAEPLGQPPGLLGDPRVTSPGSRPGPGDGVTSRGCRWCRSPWLWIGVGAAVTTAGTVWLLTRERAIESAVTVDPCEFATCP